MNDHVPPDFGAPPPMDRGPWFPIHRPTPGCPLSGVILSAGLVGVHVHYWDGHDRPCTSHVVPCSLCAHRVGRRWKGYLAVLWARKPRQVIAEVSLEAVRTCPPLADRTCDLRGLVLTLTRTGRHRNASVVAKLEDRAVNVAELPRCFDVEDSLMRIWYGLAREELRLARNGEAGP